MVKRATEPAPAMGGACRQGEKEGDAQNSLARMLGLLDLFTPSATVRPVTDLVNYLGTSRSTSYRYIKALHEAGLIEAVANGHYVLGPRIVEFDRQIRMSDPLYKGGAQVLRPLVDLTTHSALLCALYSDSVMCIRDEQAPDSPPNIFSRGQRRPLFAGAASKIILPYVPPHRLRSIFKQHQRAIAIAGLGTDWQGSRSPGRHPARRLPDDAWRVQPWGVRHFGAGVQCGWAGHRQHRHCRVGQPVGQEKAPAVLRGGGRRGQSPHKHPGR